MSIIKLQDGKQFDINYITDNDVTIDFIKNLLCSRDFIETVKYREQLEKFRRNFNLQNVKLDYTNHYFIFDMANSSIQYLFEIRNKVGSVSYENEYFFNEGLLYLENGKLCISSDYKDKIRERHCYYTKTEKQNQVLEKVKIIETALNEIKDLTGGKVFSVDKLFNPHYYRNEFVFNRQIFDYLTKK